MDDPKEPKCISIKTMNILINEIQGWAKEGLITPDQSQLLTQKYQQQMNTQSSNRIDYPILILTILGTLLMGAAAILFFSYNWENLSKLSRILIILVSMTIFQIIGYTLKKHQPKWKWLGETFVLAGLLIYGSGIWLIATMYNISDNPSMGFLYWSLGAIGVAYASDSILAICLGAIMLFAAHISSDSIHFIPYYFSLLVWIAGIAPFLYLNKSKLAIWIAVLALACINPANHYWNHSPDFINLISFYVYLGYGCILIIIGLLQKTNKTIKKAYLFMGSFIIFLILFITSAHSYFPINGYEYPFNAYQNIIISQFIIPVITVIIGTLLLICLFQNKVKLKEEIPQYSLISGILIFLLISSLVIPYILKTHYVVGIPVLVFSTNILYLFLGYLLISTGEKLNSMAMIYWGAIAIFILCWVRYFDLFDDMLSQSFFFLVLGLAMMGAGYWINRKRKDIKNRRKMEELS